jgi:hypothetical protein
MSADEPLNPYHKWLGIPLKDQPPDHYRLLGVERFESDPDVIANAADQRMAHIKAIASGKNAPLSQQLLNELAAARVCLLNAQQKAQYDEWLGRHLPVGAGHAGPPAPPETPGRAAALAPPPVVGPQRGAALAGAPWRTWLFIGMLGFGAGVGLIVVFLLFGRPGRPIDRRGDRRARPVAARASPARPSAQETGAEPSEDQKDAAPDARRAGPATPALADKGSSAPASVRGGEGPAAPAEKQEAMSDGQADGQAGAAQKGRPATSDEKPAAAVDKTGKPGPPASSPAPGGATARKKGRQPPTSEGSDGQADSARPAKRAGASKTADESKERPKDAPPADDRLSVPDAATQAKAEKAVREMVKPEDAKEVGERTALVAKLLSMAEDTKDDPAARYVLQRMAWETAAEIGQFERAMEIIDGMTRAYKASPVRAKAEMLFRTLRKAGPGPQGAQLAQQIVDAGLVVAEQAVREDQFSIATTLLEDVALPAARKARDREALGDVTKLRTLLNRQKEEFEKLRSALADNPNDPHANLALGRRLGVVKGQWDKAMPYLAKAADEELAFLAKRDLAAPEQPPQQVELADQWWEWAGELRGKDREYAGNVRQRAAYWYRRALPSLAGIVRQKAEKRVAQTAATGGRAVYALAFDGLQSSVAVAPFPYDGTVPITIEVLVRPSTQNAAGGRMVGPGTVIGNMDNDHRSGFSLAYDDNGSWTFDLAEAYRNSPAARNDSIRHWPIVARAPGEPGRGDTQPWVHVAAVYDLKEIRLYVDGKFGSKQEIVGRHQPTPPTQYPLLLGAAPHVASGQGPLVRRNFFSGQIKAVRISNVARYTNSFPPPSHLAREDAYTQLLLVFDKGSGETVEDSSGRRGSASGGKRGKRAPTFTVRLNQAKWVRIDQPEPPPGGEEKPEPSSKSKNKTP